MRRLAAKTGQRPNCWSKGRSAREGPSRSYCPQRDRTEDRRAVWLVGDDQRNSCHRSRTRNHERPPLAGRCLTTPPLSSQCSEGGACPGRAWPRGPGARGSRTWRDHALSLWGVSRGAGSSGVFERRRHPQGRRRHSPPLETQSADGHPPPRPSYFATVLNQRARRGFLGGGIRGSVELGSWHVESRAAGACGWHSSDNVRQRPAKGETTVISRPARMQGCVS